MSKGDELVPSALVGEYVGIPARKIARLASEGHVPKQGANKYNLKESVLAYCDWLRGQLGGDDSVAAGYRRNSENRERLLQAQAMEREIKAEKLAGGVLAREDVEEFALGMAALYVGQLEGLAGRLAPILVNETNPAIIHEIISDEINSVREAVTSHTESIVTGDTDGDTHSTGTRSLAGSVGRQHESAPA